MNEGNRLRRVREIETIQRAEDRESVSVRKAWIQRNGTERVGE